MYDVATMTPLQRPAEFGNRRALTKQEAAEMEQYEKQRQEKNAAPSSPNREAPPVGGDTSPTHSYLEALFRFGGGVVGGYNTFWISPGDSFRSDACSDSDPRPDRRRCRTTGTTI
jgi:hypothetical protein